jgi:hypothetical protein
MNKLLKSSELIAGHVYQSIEGRPRKLLQQITELPPLTYDAPAALQFSDGWELYRKNSASDAAQWTEVNAEESWTRVVYTAYADLHNGEWPAWDVLSDETKQANIEWFKEWYFGGKHE